MYYGRLPDTLRVEVSCDVAYALRIFDGRGIMKPAEYRNRLDSLSDPAKSPSSFVVLERFVGWKDVLRRYLGFGDALRYWRMSRHPEFDAAFDWNGMDVRLLLQDRMRRSAVVYWPMLQVFETSVRRALNAANPAAIVAYHFEFADGRAFISGCRDARPETPVVGIQHGPITSMKMLYSATGSDYNPTAFGGAPLPEPDVYVVDGDAPAEIMRRASIAPERVVTTGAVRFDDVWDEIRSMPRLRERRERVRLLVAPGLHDTENVVKLVSKALGHDDRLELVIKPHPRVDPALVDRWLQATGTGPGGAAVSVVRDGTIYQWMTQSDLFLATYSSTAIEALAFGLPVVLMLPNDSPDMSLYKGLDVPVLTACNAEELRGHVQHLLSAPELMDEYTRRLVPALRRCFGPDDSESSRRLAEVCRGLLAESGIQRREQVVAK
jgi:surface carbohydrate biosynthesis protein (TIGR04326 family)